MVLQKGFEVVPLEQEASYLELTSAAMDFHLRIAIAPEDWKEQNKSTNNAPLLL